MQASLTDREFSEKLCAIGCKLQDLGEGNEALLKLAKELHDLSNVKYSPHTVWADTKKQFEQRSTPKKKRYYDELRRELPF